MSIFTFFPTTTSRFLDWNDEAIWQGGAIPDGADADVVFPIVALNGAMYPYYVSIGAADVVSVRSIALDDYLIVSGALSVSQDLTANAGSEIDVTGGTLTVGSLVNAGYDLQGYGGVQSSGTFTNNSEVVGDGLTLELASLSNPGTLLAASGGGLTVDVAAGDFANLDGATLSGGTYEALAGDLDISAGALVMDIAADVILGYGDIASFDPAIGQYVAFEASVDEIAATGVLTLAGGDYVWGPLADYGAIDMEGGTLLSANLQVTPGGEIQGYGTIDTALDDAGAIDSGFLAAAAGDDVMSATLRLAGAVTGAGTLEISAGLAAASALPGEEYAPQSYVSTLELGAAASQTVTFANNVGVLELDDPAAFSGTIQPSGWGDQIVLGGVSLGSITSVSYQDNRADGGTLTLNAVGGIITLNFLGEFTAANFALAAMPSALSTGRASLAITVSAVSSANYVDTAADLYALTPGQIAALAAEGVAELSASGGSIGYNAVASAEIVALGLTLSAPDGDFARESFADGSSKEFDFGADDALARVAITNADGSQDDWVYDSPGNYLGASYAYYDAVYSAEGVRERIVYYGAGGLVGQRTYAATGEAALYLGDRLVEQASVAADGSLVVDHLAAGTVAGVAYARYEVAFSSTGEARAVTWRDADDDVVATRVNAAGGYTFDVAGVSRRQKIVDAEGVYQIVVSSPSGVPASENDFNASGDELAHAYESSASAGGLNIFGNDLVVSASNIADGMADFAFAARASEVYQFFAGAHNDRIAFAPGFGAATIKGFANGDVLDLAGLFANESAAMDAATARGGRVVFTDASHDTLTLIGVTASSLTARSLGFA